MEICLICLRTDRRIQPNTKLSQLHNELCCFTIPFTRSSYCSECAYLLTKFYKFKQKCLQAAELYQDWLSGKIKDSADTLYDALPPSTLGIWKHNPKRTSIIEIDENSTDLGEEVRLNYSLDDKHTYIEKEDCNTKSVEVDDVKECIKEEFDESEISSDEQDDISSVDFAKTNHIVLETKRNEEDSTDITKLEEVLTEAKVEPKTAKRKKVSVLKKETTPSKKRKVTVKKVKPFRRKLVMDDRLEEELVVKLSSYGGIVTEDGTAIDKDVISKFMQYKEGIPIIRSLWKSTSLEDIQPLLPKIQSTLNILLNRSKDRRDKPEHKEIFDIEYLTTDEEKLKEFQRRKTYECYLKAEHKCEICYQAFKGSNHLKTHMATYHDESAGGQFCPICKMRYLASRRKKRRNLHAETHLAVYRCKLCPCVTYHRGTMKEHAEKHQGKVYHCEPCNLTFKCMSGYYRHMSVSHRRARVVCPRCGRGFPSARSLQVHTTLAHREAPEAPDGAEAVRCDQCDVTLHSQAAHEAHMLDVHEPPQDGRSSGTRPWLNPRKGTSPHLYRKHKCRACNVSRAGFGWLKAHFKWEHPDLSMDALYADKKHHLCDICGVGTNTVVLLRAHLLTHTGGSPYACELCPKTFRSAVLLRNHRFHHYPPSLPCTHCGKKFKTKSNLYNHMKGHSGNRNFKCYICSKGFLHSAALNEHIRGVHYNIRRSRPQEGADSGAGGKRTTPKKRVVERARRRASEDFSSDYSEQNGGQAASVGDIESFS